HPEGSIQSEIVELTESRVTIKAYAYRFPEDERPGVGHSSLEIPGSTSYAREASACQDPSSGVASPYAGGEQGAGRDPRAPRHDPREDAQLGRRGGRAEGRARQPRPAARHPRLRDRRQGAHPRGCAGRHGRRGGHMTRPSGPFAAPPKRKAPAVKRDTDAELAEKRYVRNRDKSCVGHALSFAVFHKTGQSPCDGPLDVDHV